MNPEPYAASGDLVVATYNIHRGVGRDGRRAPERIGAVLRELDADVVALQELEWGTQDAPHLLARLADELQCRTVAGPTLLGPDNHYGNALLTRLPVLDVERLDVSQPGHEPRGALDVTLAGRGETLRIIATHLGLRPWERRAQVRQLLAHCARGPDRPTVLMGDINEWFLWGRPLRWLHAYFGVARALPTFPATLPLFALDRIWIHPGTRIRRIEVHASALARIASDHLPLRAVIA